MIMQPQNVMAEKLFADGGTGERTRTLEKIHQLFLDAPAAIAILSGPDHRYALANAAYLELVGRDSASGFIDRPAIEVFPEPQEQSLMKLLDDVYRTGAAFVCKEMPIRLNRTADEEPSEGYFNFVYQPARDGDGLVEGVLVLAIDVTEQVRARQEIATREEQFRVMADSIPQLAWIADPDGGITWYNRRWYDYTGATPEQMKGWGWQSVHHPEFLPRVIARYKHSLETGEGFEMSFPLRGADGNFRLFLSLASPVRDAAGKIVRWFGTNTDVETQQKAEAALRQSEKLAVVGRLASSIAHEINNPLEGVMNLLYLALKTAINAETKMYLESAETELKRVSQITSQTLRFHKQSSSPVPVDIREVLDSVLTLYRGKLARDGIRFHLEVADCPPLICYAGELRQVMANLVGNALDAMPKGGDLFLRARPATNWRNGQPAVRFTIADSGQGMQRETVQHIYEPFFTTKGEVGTGLGLWVTAGIVDKHGGSIHVRSRVQPGRSGTIFTLVFPHAVPGKAGRGPKLMADEMQNSV